MQSDKNLVHIQTDECKGCKLCIDACRNHCLSLSANINKIGYAHAEFKPGRCTACGLCYYACPEPGAITVYRQEKADSGS